MTKLNAPFLFAVSAFLIAPTHAFGGPEEQRYAKKTAWVRDVVGGAKATIEERTRENDEGKQRVVESTYDWFRSGEKFYKAETKNVENGTLGRVIHSYGFDGKKGFDLSETHQIGGGPDYRQAAFREQPIRPNDLFEFSYFIDGKCLPDALASGRYKYTAQGRDGLVQFDGPYNKTQTLRFWLDPSNGYLIRKRELVGGDKAYAMRSSVTRFEKSGKAIYPAEGFVEAHFGNAAAPTVTVNFLVTAFKVERVDAKVFEPKITPGTHVRDETTGKSYKVQGGRKLAFAPTRVPRGIQARRNARGGDAPGVLPS